MHELGNEASAQLTIGCLYSTYAVCCLLVRLAPIKSLVCVLDTWQCHNMNRGPVFTFSQPAALVGDSPHYFDLHTLLTKSPKPSIPAIGACRAVWIPGQDLATPHLMRNCGSVFCHYTVRYMSVRVSARLCWSEGMPHVFASGHYDMSAQCFEITRAMPGHARACRCL